MCRPQDFVPPLSPLPDTLGGEQFICSFYCFPVLAVFRCFSGFVYRLCGLPQVIYIDWNIGYHVICQEGNDGYTSQ